jgi:hypothetical protein
LLCLRESEVDRLAWPDVNRYIGGAIGPYGYDHYMQPRRKFRIYSQDDLVDRYKVGSSRDSSNTWDISPSCMSPCLVSETGVKPNDETHTPQGMGLPSFMPRQRSGVTSLATFKPNTGERKPINNRVELRLANLIVSW